jgi:phage terminase Nu1 subunit (DNA packaging protein)
MNKKQSKPPTRAALAEALQVSPARITQLRKDGMPTTTIAEAKRWRDAQAGKHRGRTDSAEELRQRRIALLRQQERRTKIDADERAKKLIPIAEVDERDTRIGFAVRAALISLEHHLPPKLAGLTEQQIAAILHDELHQTLEQLSDERSDFWKSRKTS